ncbi:hypothetical protein BofuT4_P086350.1 [Botrytis cinerea T4]|uniref:Uncharacterized protein n=1 Tax=Botryotinia fuckeliana (strain T4) TaxID=999810 RepID=G2YGF8_BOTF4|nr:hypothetical protein BofuT4_P086350.1 [Botrytis cinerea T4]
MVRLLKNMKKEKVSFRLSEEASRTFTLILQIDNGNEMILLNENANANANTNEEPYSSSRNQGGGGLVSSFS